MLAVIPAKNRIQENAVSKIVSLRPDQDQHNKPKTKNKGCQTKTTTKTIFRQSEAGLVIRSTSQTTSVVHCVVQLYSASAVHCAQGDWTLCGLYTWVNGHEWISDTCLMFKVLNLFVNYYNKDIKYMTQTMYFTDEY